MDKQIDHLVDGKYGILDLVDIERLRKIFEMFTESTGFTIGFLDHPDLNILIATGWRDICTKYHRHCPMAAENCLKSNKHLLGQLIEPGKIVVEACENGLVDCATPIMIKGKHVASLATGQLFLKPPDIELFRQQARLFGIDEALYLEALKEIPVVSESRLKSITGLLGEIALIISELGYANLEIKEEAALLEKEIHERKRAEEALRLKNWVFDSSLSANSIADIHGVITEINDTFWKIWGYPNKAEVIGKSIGHFLNNQSEAVAIVETLDRMDHWEGNYIARKMDGSTFSAHGLATVLRDEHGHAIGYQSAVEDITDRKRGEDALRESEARYRRLLAATTDYIYTVRVENGRAVETTHGPGCTVVTGRAPEEYKENPDLWYQMVHSDDRAQVLAMAERALKGLSVEPLEHRIYRKDGTICWLRDTVVVRKDIAGVVIGYDGLVSDITVRKHAEEESLRSGEQYRALIETTATGYVIIDILGRVKDANAEYVRLTGRHAFEEIYDKSVLEWTGGHEKERNSVAIERCLRDGYIRNFEIEYITPEGQVIPVEINGTVLGTGEGLRILTLCRDITERKRVGRQLEEYREHLEEIVRVRTSELTHSNERLLQEIEEHKKAEVDLEDSRSYLDKIINSIPDPIFVKDREHKFVLMNDAVCALMGRKRKDIIGRGDYEFFPKDQADVFWAKDEEVFVSGKENLNEEFFSDGAGIIRTIMTKKTLYVDGDGNKFIVGVIRDMTEIKQATEQLVAAQARMVQAEKMASLGQLVSGIAHEINNPCGYVLSNLDTLKEYEKNLVEYWSAVRKASHMAGKSFVELEEKLNVKAILKDMPHLVSESVDGAQRIARIVEDLRMFSHPEGGNWEYRDLHQTLKRALNIVMAELKNRIEVVSQYGELPLVRMKEQQIVQVFINLLTNASQAIHGLGRVTMKTYVHHKDVYVEISDTGEGIAPEDLSKVFDPFYTTKPIGKGTGLGLSVVHGIIERHGGTVTVRSQLGKGSTFIIKLPIDANG
ncbi:MAG: PAS domain S-box protein [Candidatus Omnitrophica bacterium]|nr:PAS domain S-box protein [Candidatus Omnitrophota bacterium]